jgi:DNA-binding transcriptional regulator PaaX
MSGYEDLNKKYKSSIHYILKSLIPYSDPNLKLAFHPNQFFNDLEKLDAISAKRKSLRTSYYRAIARGLVKIDKEGIPRLTVKGQRKVKVYKPKKLKGSSLMVIFDIPEAERYKRQRFRTLLRELSFKQIQRSVWESRFDHRQYLRAEIAEMKLQEYVKVYETAQIEI